MEQITISILTLLSLYVLYSECIKLPKIIKKNKKLCYVLVVGLYFYYHRTNVVEGRGLDAFGGPGVIIALVVVCIIFAVVLNNYDPDDFKVGGFGDYE